MGKKLLKTAGMLFSWLRTPALLLVQVCSFLLLKLSCLSQQDSGSFTINDTEGEEKNS